MFIPIILYKVSINNFIRIIVLSVIFLFITNAETHTGAALCFYVSTFLKPKQKLSRIYMYGIFTKFKNCR